MKSIKNYDNTFSEFLLYRDANNDVKVEVYIMNETIWLTQAKMAELFDVQIPAINKHLKNIYDEYELLKDSTISILEIVQKEGKRSIKRKVEFYNLDAIIAVGYRVNSKKATMFRIWATKVLKEYIIKGFAMDDERLKNPNYTFGQDYFEEQLNRIRNIRSSERRFYQKITDIYAECSADYDPNSDLTITFYKTVQNKLHFAITGKTAAEIIQDRVDSSKKNMGLTNWKNAPKGKIRKEDVVLAKNYLNEEELSKLNRIVSMYLDYAEMQAENKVVMNMKDWVEKLNAFLNFNQLDILNDSGKISHEVAKELAIKEYEKYNAIQDNAYVSDFDKLVDEYLKKESKYD
jgi:hypothetical protein